jgi:ketosteroid isomerase-like protein
MSAPVEETAKLDLRLAMERGDLEAVLDTFAPDAVLRSPLTSRLTFNGREQIEAVMGVVIDVFEDLRYTDQLVSGDRAVLVASARVGGKELEMVDHLRLDEQGKIRELTVFFRPFPSIAVAMRLIATGLGARKGKGTALAMSALTQPLGPLTAVGDRIGAALVKSTI